MVAGLQEGALRVPGAADVAQQQACIGEECSADVEHHATHCFLAQSAQRSPVLPGGARVLAQPALFANEASRPFLKLP